MAPGYNIQGIVVTLLAVFLALLLWTRQTATGQKFWSDISGLMTMKEDEFIKRKARMMGLTVLSPEEQAHLDQLRETKMAEERVRARADGISELCQDDRIPELCFATKDCNNDEEGLCNLVGPCNLGDKCGGNQFNTIAEKLVQRYRGNICNGEKQDLCRLQDICGRSTVGACGILARCNLNLNCPHPFNMEGFRESICGFAGSGGAGDPCVLLRDCGGSRSGACKLIETCNLNQAKCAPPAPKQRRIKVSIKTFGGCPGHDLSKDITLDILVNDPSSSTTEEVNQLIKRQLRRKLTAKFGDQCEFDIKHFAPMGESF